MIGIDTSFLVAFELPLPMDDAIERIERWWRAREVRIIPTGEVVGMRFINLM